MIAIAVTAVFQALLIVTGLLALLATLAIGYDCLAGRYCDCGPGAHHPSCHHRTAGH